jgi:hypothetical protein
MEGWKDGGCVSKEGDDLSKEKQKEKDNPYLC